MVFSGADKQVLRELARRVADVAALPVQAERTRLWRGCNALRPQRPMVLSFPEGAWCELLPDAALQCTDPLARAWERALRVRLYTHEQIGDDQPVTDRFNVGWVVRFGDYGLIEKQIRPETARGAYRYESPVKSMADVAKLHPRSIEIDRTETARRVQMAEEVLGDLLRVRVHGALWWSCGMTWTLIRLRGLEQIMLDMYDHPRLLHALMSLLRDDTLNVVDTLEREGVLSLNNGPDDYVGSGGIGATDALPAPGFDGRVRPQDMWVLGESQETVGVGPAQFEEFVLRYQLPILNRFGLVCYGCCEPLDQKFDLVLRGVRRLRRVSVSPWCDRRVAAEKLGDRYVYSWKPNPALICGPTVDWDEAEKAIRETLEIARGCCLEIVMKDTHTFHHDPTRIRRWTQMALALAAEA
jgi:hypothetical protein